MFKLSVYSLLVVAMVMGFGACSKKGGSNIGRSGRTGVANVTQIDAALSNRPWGLVAGSDDDTFRRALLSFLNLGDAQLGYVSSYPDSYSMTGTGVYFRGLINISGGLMNYNGSRRNLESSGAFEVQVWDEYAVNGDDNGKTYPPVRMPFQNGISGYIEGTRAYITIADGYGKVVLTGDFNVNGDFSGIASYENNSNNGGGRGTLGEFQVQTCGFFRCN